MTRDQIQAQGLEKIRKMMDYDGFRDGDCLSRRAVIAVIETM